MNLLSWIDKLLNKVTMYRLVVYALATYVVLAIGFAFAGKVSASPTELVVSLSAILIAAYVTDRGLGRFLGVPTNMESSLITSLILFLILNPADSLSSALILALAGAIASASKFLIAYNGKHIFNPAAFGAAVLSLTSLGVATWWIGSSIFWPVTLLFGLAVVRKIRRFPLFFVFAAVAIVLQLLLFVQAGRPVADAMQNFLISSPLIFLSTIMLTEPATMPPRRAQQMIYGAIVAVLYVTSWQLGPLVVYPEVALLLGNIFAYAVSPKFRVRLQLKEVRQVSSRVYDFVFQPDRTFKFRPGQYMEWTLPHIPYDSRGNRRTFTIASSPTEADVHLGIKFYEPASLYKASLMDMKPGSVIYASQLSGNFTLNGHEDKKLAFIAGGIGITPFRSMVKYLTDTQKASDIVLLYVVSDAQEFAYVEELKAAAQIGIKTIPIVTDLSYQSAGVVTTKLDAKALSQLLPDYAERTFYVSGPNAMVDGTKQYLHQLKVPTTRIKTDHFSGY
jgi:ferredoxin-NADP reductase